MQVEDRSVFATLNVERLADIAGVPGRRTKPQMAYVWPENPDVVMGSVAKAMRDQPVDVPLHVLGVLPAWLLALLALRGDWTEVWACHVEDGSPWMHVSVPGYNDQGLPTITGVVWARPTDPLHCWTTAPVTANGGRLNGTRLLRGTVEDVRETHVMNTHVPVLEVKNGILLLSSPLSSGSRQVQQAIMVAHAAVAYSQPGDRQAGLVAVKYVPNAYVVVHSTIDGYGVGSVIRTP